MPGAEFQTKVHEIFKIPEKGLLLWLKAPTRAFTFKNLLRHYANWVADAKIIRDGLVG